MYYDVYYRNTRNYIFYIAMAAGYIYFAETSTPYIKVGRALATTTVAKKEATRKTLDPCFKIRHAYPCDDIVREENRVLRMLRLVAGTEVKGAGRECYLMDIESAVKIATGGPVGDASVARNLILNHIVAGKSIRDLIAEPDSVAATDNTPLAATKTYSKNMIILSRLGIVLLKNGYDHGLATDTYATVVDERLIKRHIPGLKRIPTDLKGFALY